MLEKTAKLATMFTRNCCENSQATWQYNNKLEKQITTEPWILQHVQWA